MNLENVRKIFLVGDLHLGVKNNSLEWLQIQKEFLLDFLTSSIDLDFDENRDILILEGDVFHSRESINVRVQNEAFDIFKILSNKFKRGIYIIIGNHDVYYKDKNEVHSLKSLSHLSKNIHVFEKPEILKINKVHNFLMLPWVENKSDISKIISDYSNLCEYVICHADIKGVKFNKWTKVEHGVDLDSLSSYKRVYSGHIHHRQTVKNVLYTGAPYQMDRGDRENVKGFYVLDVESKNIVETFIENTKSPTYIKMDIYEVLEMDKKTIKEKFFNKFVDITISLNFINKFPIPRFLELLSDSGYRKIEFFTYAEESTDQITHEFNVEDEFNIIDIFKKYVKSQDYPNTFKFNLAKKFVEIHNSIKSEQ